jgi:vacuolar-type H+-ATPase subunit H
MGLLEKKAQEQFERDRKRAEQIAEQIAAERKQDAKDKKSGRDG